MSAVDALRTHIGAQPQSTEEAAVLFAGERIALRIHRRKADAWLELQVLEELERLGRLQGRRGRLLPQLFPAWALAELEQHYGRASAGLYTLMAAMRSNLETARELAGRPVWTTNAERIAAELVVEIATSIIERAGLRRSPVGALQQREVILRGQFVASTIKLVDEHPALNKRIAADFRRAHEEAERGANKMAAENPPIDDDRKVVRVRDPHRSGDEPIAGDRST